MSKAEELIDCLEGGDVMYFHKDRFDAALLADMAAHCAAKGVV